MSRSTATRRGFILSALCGATFLTAGLAAGNAHADGEEQMLTITGELSYRQRIALPPDAVAFVEIRADGMDAAAPAVAQTLMKLEGKQVPVTFSLEVPQAHLESGVAYLLGGGIRVDDQVNWRVAEPVRITTAAPHFNAGVLMMAQQQVAEPVGQKNLAGEWRIVKVGDETLAGDANASLVFDADGAFSGRLCNSFRGTYSVDGTAISFGQTAATLMACPDPLGRQEHALFTAFESAASFEIAADGTLRLLDDKGQTLVSARR